MKPLIMAAAITLSLLFSPAVEEYGDEKTVGSFTATIDNKAFKLREDQLYRGLLMTKSASMDGRTPSRTVINTTFNGSSYDLDTGHSFSETVQFEIGYEGEKTGEPSNYAVALQYNSTNYFMIPDGSKISITQFSWESDKKHFMMSAEFNCKMRSFGYPADNKPDVTLKGKMNDIRITVPSWIHH